MIKVTNSGSFDNAMAFLQRMKERTEFQVLSKYGPMGVTALRNATPKDTSETADSWYFEIVDKPGYYSIHWLNFHLDNRGTPIVVLIQYGHGTRQGAYVHGIDFINPALKPIFDQMANDMWKEVTK